MMIDVEITKLNELSKDKSNYDEIVKICRDLLTARKDIKIQIGLISIQLCDDQRGGKKSKSSFTLQDFAKDIGVKYKTLWRWRKEAIVVKKLDIQKDLPGKLDRVAIDRILGQIKADHTKKDIQDLYQKEISLPQEDRKLKDDIKYLNTLKFHIVHEFYLPECDPDLLDIIYNSCIEIAKAIETKRNKITQSKQKRARAKIAVEKLLNN